MKQKRFFGLHFDFHAGNTVKIGTRTDPDDIQHYIDSAKPDFIQCDCKGHPGNCSYPTKVGKAADKLESDNLRVWCDVAKKNGLPIFMHYSGVWDDAYTKSHPKQAAVDADGNITNRISLFGNYVDDLMIPQIKELITEYGVDGIWVDGDCWAVQRDYSDLAKPHLYEGITEQEHNKIMRDAFMRYFKHYVDEIHAFAPDFIIASNWAYSSYIPEKPTVNVDFISGDFPCANSVHEARYEARCIAAQGKPWDLMAWGFELQARADKSAVQLCQESAMTLSLGGGFQVYITQNADGSARRYPQTDQRLSVLSNFVHARKITFEKQPLAQVGVFYSAESFYKKSNIYNAAGATKPLIGMLNAVLDAQYTANIVLEHQLDTLSVYDIVIIPEWESIREDQKEAFLAYAEKGGNLLIAGATACMQFGKKIGASFGKQTDQARYIAAKTGEFWHVQAPVLDLKSGEDMLYSNKDIRDTASPAYKILPFGKGTVTLIPFALGTQYHTVRSYIVADFLQNILQKLQRPLITINRKNIDLTIQQAENGWLVNLVNMHQGRHSQDVVVYNDIPPVYDIDLTIQKPFCKVAMPLGEDFRCTYEKDCVRIHLHHLDIHSIIQLESPTHL